MLFLDFLRDESEIFEILHPCKDKKIVRFENGVPILQKIRCFLWSCLNYFIAVLNFLSFLLFQVQEASLHVHWAPGVVISPTNGGCPGLALRIQLQRLILLFRFDLDITWMIRIALWVGVQPAISNITHFQYNLILYNIFHLSLSWQLCLSRLNFSLFLIIIKFHKKFSCRYF